MDQIQLVISKRDIENANLARLPQERQKTILAIKDGIALTYDNTLDYASEATSSLTAFSTDLLRSVRNKDMPEVAGLVDQLLSNLYTVDTQALVEKKGFFGNLFFKNEVKSFTARYDSAAEAINEVKDKLEETAYHLKKDIELCNRFLEQNCNYINSLDNYILAGKLRINEEKEAIEKAEKELDKTDTLAIQMHTIRKSEVDRLERKLHDLMLMREIAVQNIPQIMMIRDGDGVLVEKIQTSINSAIPLWESQMVIVIQLLRQKGALAVQKGVSQATNTLIEKNGELLRSGSIEVAKELESGVIDVEVLKKNSENLVKTLKTIKSIQAEGASKRLEATRQLASLQSQLNESLMLGPGEER